MNLLSSYSLLYDVSAVAPELLDLKPLIAPWTGQRLRRVDRYIELCVAGGLNCVSGRKLAADTGVYLATRCGAVTTSSRVMENIISNRDMPKPLHFINTLGNSACFYLTQLLHTTGNTLVISQEHLSFEAALFHAWLDLQQGHISAALIGGIDEVVLPLELHAQRLDVSGSESFSEGSHWLLLEKAAATDSQQMQLQLTPPQYLADIDALGVWLAQYQVADLQCSFVPNAEEERQLIPLVNHLSCFTAKGAQHGVFSGAALIHLSEVMKQKGGFGVHLARAPEGRYCALGLRANTAVQA